MSDTDFNPILDKLHAALGGNLPPALRGTEAWEVMPLAIGSRDALVALVVARGMDPAEAGRLVNRTLVQWTNTMIYQAALTADGAWRYDLDGNRVEPVAKEHCLAASMNLLTRALRDHGKRTGAPNPPPKPPAANQSTRSPLVATTPPRSTTPTAPTPVTTTAARPARPDPGPHRSTRPAPKDPK